MLPEAEIHAAGGAAAGGNCNWGEARDSEIELKLFAGIRMAAKLTQQEDTAAASLSAGGGGYPPVGNCVLKGVLRSGLHCEERHGVHKDPL